MPVLSDAPTPFGWKPSTRQPSQLTRPISGVRAIGPKQLALHIAQIVDERQGMEISILDVTGPLVIADFFVVATVRNDRHGISVARELISLLKADGIQRRNAAGMDGETGWVLLDFDEIVVHLLLEDSREFYDLENLWHDAPRVPFTPAVPAEPASSAADTSPASTPAPVDRDEP